MTSTRQRARRARGGCVLGNGRGLYYLLHLPASQRAPSHTAVADPTTHSPDAPTTKQRWYTPLCGSARMCSLST
eukprot:gene3698-biopygen21802